jgi:AcrR family transcriptional regulator
MTAREAVLEEGLVALNALCGERPWREVTLRDVAEKAGLALTDLYREAQSKVALIEHLGARLDEATLATAGTPSDDVHDRLFDAAMGRIEAMAPWRGVLAAVDGSALVFLAPHLAGAARAILEAAGVEATPARLAAMAVVWGRILQVWRADGGACNRTMAELDRRLKQMRERLRLVGAGF